MTMAKPSESCPCVARSPASDHEHGAAADREHPQDAGAHCL